MARGCQERPKKHFGKGDDAKKVISGRIDQRFVRQPYKEARIMELASKQLTTLFEPNSPFPFSAEISTREVESERQADLLEQRHSRHFRR